ncbi:hypothetical protein Tco_0400297 [Tanacetum coccineum]
MKDSQQSSPKLDIHLLIIKFLRCKLLDHQDDVSKDFFTSNCCLKSCCLFLFLASFEVSSMKNASDTVAAPKPTTTGDSDKTTTISNIKVPSPIRKEGGVWNKWAMEMEHYLKYNDNEVGKLEAHGAEVSTEDANHKFLRSLPPACSNLAMTMRTKPDVDTLSIDDFTFTPSTSSTNIPEKEALASFANEVIYSLFAKQSEVWDLLHEDLEQIDDLDIEEMDINWQIAMISIRIKKFYKKIGRRVCVDGKTPVGFDKKKLECFNCHNTGHFARNFSKGTHGKEKERLIFINTRSRNQREESDGLADNG